MSLRTLTPTLTLTLTLTTLTQPTMSSRTPLVVTPSLTPAPAGSVTLTSFSGGSVDDLKATLAECGGDVAAHATTDTGWVSYIPGATIPAANAAFNAHFADGIPATIFQVTNCGS